MIDWFAPSGRPIHVLLTKSDKLSRGAAATALNQVRAALEQYNANGSSARFTAQLFSSLAKTGIEECERVMGTWLGREA
jgi:GTP-binding protein